MGIAVQFSETMTAQDEQVAPVTQPPVDAVTRLAALAQELATLGQNLGAEWTRNEETRSALAKVLEERQAQHERDAESRRELEARVAAAERARDEALQARGNAEQKQAEQDQKLAAAEREAESERQQGAERLAEAERKLGEAQQAREAAEQARGELDRAAAAQVEKLAALERDLASERQASDGRQELERKLVEVGTASAAAQQALAEAERRGAEQVERVAELERQLAEASKAQQADPEVERRAAEQAQRLTELEGKLAAAEQSRDELQAARTELEARTTEQLATAARDLDAERARAQEERAALEAEAARERVRAEELRAQTPPEEGTAAVAAARIAELLKALDVEQQRASEAVAQRDERDRQLAAEREAQARQATRLAELEKQQTEGRPQAERAQTEASELKMQVEGLMRQADGERARWQEERSGIAAERYKALSESAQLRVRVEDLERQLAEKPVPSEAVPDQRERVVALEGELAAAKASAEARERLSSEAEVRRAEAAGQLTTLKEELASLQRQIAEAGPARTSAEQAAQTAELARKEAEAERDRAKAEASPLWGTIDSLQRQLDQERDRFKAQLANAASPQDLADVKRQYEQESAVAQAARRQLAGVEAELKALRERSKIKDGTLKSVVSALRRTPFVAPTLKVAADTLESEAELELPKGKGLKLLFLDRDPLSIEPLVQDLEQHGVDVLIAHFPEEVAFFLRTPEAKTLGGLVADAMAFRSDQDMIERYKAWRHELAGVPLVVSYRADQPIEAERARQVPSSAGAIHVARTVGREALLETLSRRSGKPPDPGSGVFRLFKR